MKDYIILYPILVYNILVLVTLVTVSIAQPNNLSYQILFILSNCANKVGKLYCMVYKAVNREISLWLVKKRQSGR